MQKRIYTGQNTTEIVIILALIAIVGIAIWATLGKTITQMIGNSNVKVAKYDPFNTGSKPLLKKGSLGGTPSKPVTNCSGDTCIIDYGEFILQGIPDNFNEYVESIGSSGGTEVLLGLMEQIAKQLEEEGDTTGAQEFRDLANLGHFITANQKVIEDEAKACSATADFDKCLQTVVQKSTSFPLPDNIKHILPDYETYKSADRYSFSSVNDIATGKNEKLSFTKTYESRKTGFPAYMMVDIFDSIQANSSYSDAMKNVTTELYRSIDKMNGDFHGEMQLYSYAKVPGRMIFDPITGAYTGDKYYSKDAGVDDIIHPETALNNNLRSALICATGSYDDEGNECK